jgi:lantibiotic modifying enzyme
MDRRDFFRVAAAGSLLMGSGGFRWPSDSLGMAEATGAWIRAQGIETLHGLTWPVAPSQSEADALHLYSGTPGIVLFLLELHHATGDSRYLEEAEAGARHLAAVAGQSVGTAALPGWGLYTGLAGVVYTLSEVHRAGGDEGIGDATGELAERLLDDARPLGEGVAWYEGDADGAVYDVIGGSAGIGLTLLYLHETRNTKGALEMATRAGKLLATKGRPEHNGLKWPMSEAYPRLMPNFSHGTAGVAYFLGRLYEVTGDIEFLAPAHYGAVYMENISICDARGGCLAFHHEPDGEDLNYLGWCHGPVGTARLFRQMESITGDEHWKRWPMQGARGLRHQGIPEIRVEGYWNNVSQCCGDAGAGDFFLSLYASGADPEGFTFARRLGNYLLGEATEEEGTSRWIQAENRTQPENVVAQTGWMQGAAGVGAFFLHLDGMEKGRLSRVVFPDSPWKGFI